MWTYLFCTGRNQAYHTRIELAVFDHNTHVKRDHARNKKGDLVYHRKYRKQSKKWDVTPTLTTKKFLYIPKLLHEIDLERESHGNRNKSSVVLPSYHPAQIQSTIGHTEPLATSEIVAKKIMFYLMLY